MNFGASTTAELNQKRRKRLDIDTVRRVRLGDGNGQADAPEIGYHWARFPMGADENGEAIFGPKFRVKANPDANYLADDGRDVLIQKELGQWKVKGSSVEDLEQAGIDTRSLNANDRYRHFRYFDELVNFNSYDLKSGLKVSVRELVYEVPSTPRTIKIWRGSYASTHVDLADNDFIGTGSSQASILPTVEDTHRYALLVFSHTRYVLGDPCLLVYPGVPISLFTELSEADLQTCYDDLPDDELLIAIKAYYLEYGQTKIAGPAFDVDVRQLINIPSTAGGGMESFTISADIGTPEDVENGDDVAFVGGDGIGTSVSVPDTITISVLDGGITTDKLADDAVTQDKIADNAIGTAQLQDNAVNTSEIADNAVTNAKLADNAVNTAEIADNAITQAKMADNSVGTAEIVALNVTTAKIADLAVTDAKINDVAASKITGILGLDHGGSGADLSATGGVGQYVKQAGAGTAFTVGTIPSADIATALTTPGTIGGTTPNTGAFTTLSALVTDAATNTTTNVLTIGHNSSGTPAASYGTGLLFQGHSSTNTVRDMGRIRTVWTTATDASRTANLVLSAWNVGTETDMLTISPTAVSIAALLDMPALPSGAGAIRFRASGTTHNRFYHDGTTFLMLNSTGQMQFRNSANAEVNFFTNDIARFRISGAGLVSLANTSISPTVQLGVSHQSALTNALQTIIAINHNTTGTPAAGFGESLLFALESSTNENRAAAQLDVKWATATDASRASQLDIGVYSVSTKQIGLSILADAGGVKTSVNDVPPVAPQTYGVPTGTPTRTTFDTTTVTTQQLAERVYAMIIDLQAFGAFKV